MDQNNDPFFTNTPSEQPGEAPQQMPAGEPGAQIYSPPPSASYAPPPVQPVRPASPPPANNARRIWLIVLIFILVLCGCCILLGTLGWFFGDAVLCSIDPSFGTCPVP